MRGGGGDGGRWWWVRGGGGFPLCGDFAFYVFECVASVCVEIWVAERPAMFTKLIIIRILDLVKVVFIQLPYERRKVGVLEHSGEYRFRELVHILDDKTIPHRSPRNDLLKCRVFQHLVQLFHKITRRRHRIFTRMMSMSIRRRRRLRFRIVVRLGH